MERGSELSKTVATFIVQRILLDENGINYVCNTAERFYAVRNKKYFFKKNCGVLKLLNYSRPRGLVHFFEKIPKNT
jgi:hypothetical protein